MHVCVCGVCVCIMLCVYAFSYVCVCVCVCICPCTYALYGSLWDTGCLVWKGPLTEGFWTISWNNREFLVMPGGTGGLIILMLRGGER